MYWSLFEIIIIDVLCVVVLKVDLLCVVVLKVL
jgi:hypothetical protein